MPDPFQLSRPDPDTDMVFPLIEGLEAYPIIKATIELLAREFPEKQVLFTPGRLQGWIEELQRGDGRDEDEIRDNIFEFIVTKDELMSRYSIDEATADAIILGENEGGMNFSQFIQGFDAGGGERIRPGSVIDEERDRPGVGTGGEDEETQLHILVSRDMRWHYDRDANKWYVSYSLPGSRRRAVFEAEPEQMDALFGDGGRPVNFEEIPFQRLFADGSLNTFSGNILDVEGEGDFEDHYHRSITIALEGGTLPEWAAKDGAAMDILFLAAEEDKPMSWIIEQLSKTDSFKARFPGIAKIRETANVSLADAITGYLEFEAGTRQALIGAGLSPELATPTVVGALLEAGHSLKTVDVTVKSFDRMKKFAPAMDAFNSILAAQGRETITSIQDMFDFVSGKAPTDLYDIWEASTLAEAANLAGLGEHFTADDAIQVALQTAGSLTGESVTAAMQKSAELALRLRHELDMGKFDLDHEDLIDMNLNQPLRSGRSVAEVGANIQRVIQAANEQRNQQQVGVYAGFDQEGRVQSRSLGSLRQSS